MICAFLIVLLICDVCVIYYGNLKINVKRLRGYVVDKVFGIRKFKKWFFDSKGI